MHQVLSNRTLNRTLLARQGLIETWDCPPIDAIERLIGLQAQAPMPPYFGLFSRLTAFDPQQLSELLEHRQVVRIALMRSTLQLVSARDCLQLRPVLADDLLRKLPAALRNRSDLTAIAAAARDQLEREPGTFAELGSLLGSDFDGLAGPDLGRTARTVLALVQLPPRGLWGRTGPAVHTTAEHWLGQPLAATTLPDQLIRRYLAAFGPASAPDLAAWSGMTGLGAVLRRLAPELRSYRGEGGQLLYDLAEASLVDPATTVPVRILAEFDNVLLGHADRSRIFDDQHRGRFMTTNGLVSSTVLIDGFVAGSCRLQLDGDRARLTVQPFRTLRPGQRRAVRDQAERLLGFAAPGRQPEVHFA